MRIATQLAAVLHDSAAGRVVAFDAVVLAEVFPGEARGQCAEPHEQAAANDEFVEGMELEKERDARFEECGDRSRRGLPEVDLFRSLSTQALESGLVCDADPESHRKCYFLTVPYRTSTHARLGGSSAWISGDSFS